MSNVYGRLNGDLAKTEVTRRGSSYVRADLNTWDGSISVSLSNDGVASIRVDNLGVNLHGLSIPNPGVSKKEYLDNFDLMDLKYFIEKIMQNSHRKKHYPRYRLPQKEYKAFMEALELSLAVPRLKSKM